MDALITIVGRQRNFGETEEEEIEVISKGKYYQKDGVHYIFYEEQIEEMDAVAKASLKIESERVEMRKKGAVDSHMIFELGKKTNSMYRTEFGIMEMGMDTDEIRIKKMSNALDVEFHYIMEVNCQTVGENTVQISAQWQ